MRSLDAYIGTDHVGTLWEGSGLWAFEYAPHWLQAANGFDLSPALARRKARHEDTGTSRPVQWYFDNLLPEEALRQAVAKEAGIPDHQDAFALLEYLGAESAGSLTLLAPGVPVPTETGLRRLADDELSQRIRDLPRATLTRGSPKRMSLAGAQHKLLVNDIDGELYEPVGATASTHILKPNHPSPQLYPASVLNEFLTMRLAHKLGLQVPRVTMRFVPEPVYLVERFDRLVVPGADGHMVARRHIIDACQLLNKDRVFKHTSASLAALAQIIDATTNRAATRQRLFLWLVFNVLVGNDDCHLKNLSFLVGADAIALAPHYDLLTTGVYHTKAVAAEHALWPDVPMAIPLPGAKTFGEVRNDHLLQAAEQLGVPRSIALREIKALVAKLPAAAQSAMEEAAELSKLAPPETVGANNLVARAAQHIVFRDMLSRLTQAA